MLNKSNAQELAEIAREAGAVVMRGQVQYPGPMTGEWEIGSNTVSEVLYQLRDRQLLIILAPVEGEPVHLCGICGFTLSKPSEACPRCALHNEDAASALDGKRVAESVENWLQEQRPPHPLEVELEQLQATLDALATCPPLWWADKLLWRGLRWFYRMRQRRVREALDDFERPKPGRPPRKKDKANDHT